jgi:multiple sugar transport system permease protein
VTRTPRKAARAAETAVPRRRRRHRHVGTYTFIILMAILWIFPLIWTIYASLRTNQDTTLHGYFSLPSGLTLDNYIDAWNGAEIPRAYLNTLVITIPSVIVALLVSSMVAFALTRFKWRFNIPLLMIFVAGNLLPQQVFIIPLSKMFLWTGFAVPAPLSDTGLLYNQMFGIILINVVFQMGFCIFVLSNYMKTLPKELVEAAQVDGAGVLRIWAGVIMPLCRPALAAMATLEFTFIYNDFFWALFLMKDGDRRPITSFLQNLNGMYYSDYSLLAAGAFLAVIPTLIVFFLLQRYFVSGLTLGSVKG